MKVEILKKTAPYHLMNGIGNKSKTRSFEKGEILYLEDRIARQLIEKRQAKELT